MNMNGSGKRKREHTAHSDTNRKQRDNGQEARSEKDKKNKAKTIRHKTIRQTEATKRKGIG